MEHTDDTPPPQTLADRLRKIAVGKSDFIEKEVASANSVRTTIVRVKAEIDGALFTTRERPAGIQVWRLA